MPNVELPRSSKRAKKASAESAVVGKGQATRQRIVSHALKLAGVRGLAGVTIGDLAQDLGISKSGLFAHFRSKEQLQLEILDAAARDFAQHVFAPALEKPRGTERLSAVFDNWLQWIRSNRIPGGCIFIAGAMEWDDREGPVRDCIAHWFEQLEAGLKRAVSLCVTEGHLRPDLDVEGFVFDMHGVMLKFHLNSRLLHSAKASSRAREAFERLLATARTRT